MSAAASNPDRIEPHLDPSDTRPDDRFPPEIDDVEKTVEAKRRQQVGRTILRFGLVGVAIVTLLSLAIYAVSGGDDAPTQSSVAKGAQISEPPGAPHLTPAQATAYGDLNDQNRDRAAKAGKSSVQVPIMTGDEEIQARRPIVAQPAPDMNVPPPRAIQPVGYSQAGASGADPRRAAMLKAINDTLAKANGVGELGGIIAAAEPATQPYTPMNAAASGKSDRTSDRSPEGTGMLLAEPHEAYAVTRIAANSDAIAPITLELLSGPLTGGIVYGKPVVQQKSMQIGLDRLHYQGADYKIEAMVIDSKTRSPALDVDVANHYGERILLPMVAGMAGAAGKAASMPTTSVNTNTGMSTITQVSPLSPEQILMAGLGGGGQAAANVISRDAENVKPTVTLDANAPQMVAFLKGVYSGDRIK